MLTNSTGSRVRIFVTSRHSQALDKGFLGFGKSLINQEIFASDTMGDIKLFVKAHMDELPVDTPEKQEELTERIPAMSSGSFLWLSKIYTEGDIESVLLDIPADMNEFYTKILENLLKDRTEAKLAKMIFTLCSLINYQASAMAFNPNTDINLLFVSYGDRELVVFEPKTTELKHRIPEVHAQTLACPPDGRTLATGSSFGTIQLCEFDGTEDDNLSLIYRINAYNEGIRALVLSGDGLRFIDIRGSHCGVWEPAVFARKSLSDNSNSDISVPAKAIIQTVGMIERSIKSDITAVAIESKGEAVFCGKQDGSVAVYNTQNGLEDKCL
ncbi:hypothetical protein NHQ30_002746 [Ciborinia camelliae]|nr:hypothetical protein NHQ30_002746 [Ciborinia camelliae]